MEIFASLPTVGLLLVETICNLWEYSFLFSFKRATVSLKVSNARQANSFLQKLFHFVQWQQKFLGVSIHLNQYVNMDVQNFACDIQFAIRVKKQI